jgi:hypothetical protein
LGGPGIIALRDLQVKALYYAASSVNQPTNNATVISTDNIMDIVPVGSYFCFLGSAGKIGNLTTSGAWNNYNSSTAYTNNASVLGAVSINSGAAQGSVLVVSGAGGATGSYDGSNWKNSSGTGTGTGPYNSGSTLTTSQPIYTVQPTSSGGFIVGAAAGVVNFIGPSPGWSITAYVTPLLTGFIDTSYLYAYRYELTSSLTAQTVNPTYSTQYIIGLIGNSLGEFFNFNSATQSYTTLSAQYAWPQVSNGLTRHILTTEGPLAGPTVAPYLVNGSNAYNIGIVGYNSFTAASWSSSEAFSPFLALGAGLAVPSNASGWQRAAGFNYAEMSYTTTAGAGAIYQLYAPQFVPSPTDFQNSIVQQTNSKFNVNHYGKLTNAFGVVPINGQQFEIRFGVIPSTGGGTPGTQQYLSAAIISGNTDNMGVLLTGIGEIDNTYCPHVVLDNTIMYRNQGNYFIITLGTPTNPLQRLTDRLYKINTISPVNIYDDITTTLQLGSMDYNGRMLVTNTATATSAYDVDMQVLGPFSNSIDVSPGTVYIGNGQVSSISYPTFTPVAYTIPYLPGNINFGVLTYYGSGTALTYVCTTKNSSSILQIYDTAVARPTWVSNATYLPTAIGYSFFYRGFLQENYTTIILNQLYLNPYSGSYNESDTFILGNQVFGLFIPFTFYGQDYLFDGNYIWAVMYDSTGTIYQGKVRIIGANGLTFLAVSPTMAYFLSSLDNSLYVFDSGRNLNKKTRLNELDTITGAVFNVHDNSLLLNGAATSGNPNQYGSLIWIRDGVITLNAKSAAQAGSLNLFDTINGIIIANNTNQWQYSFNALSGASLVPLTIQTAYMGMENNEKIRMKNVVCTLYARSAKLKSSKPIIVTLQALIREEAGIFNQIQRIFSINPGDWNSLGYYNIRLQPQFQTNLGMSIVLITQAKVNLTSMTIEYNVDGQGIYAGKATQ